MRGCVYEGLTLAEYRRLNLSRPLTEPHLTPRAAGTAIASAALGTPDRKKAPRKQPSHDLRLFRAVWNTIQREPMATLLREARAYSLTLRQA